MADTRAAANTATGTVALSGGSGAFGTPTCTLSSGSCTDTFTPSAKGTSTLTATYSGDATHVTSKGTDKLKVT